MALIIKGSSALFYFAPTEFNKSSRSAFTAVNPLPPSAARAPRVTPGAGVPLPGMGELSCPLPLLIGTG